MRGETGLSTARDGRGLGVMERRFDDDARGDESKGAVGESPGGGLVVGWWVGRVETPAPCRQPIESSN